MLGLGCCWLERTLCSATKSSPLSWWWASFPMYVKRMVVMYCETVLRLYGIRPPALRYGASSYMSMGMLAYLGSSSIWCLSIFTSALLHGGIPMCFQWKKRMLVICLRGQSHVWAASWRFLLFPCLSTVSILFVSATKVQRIREKCKRIKEKWCYSLLNSIIVIFIESSTYEILLNL